MVRTVSYRRQTTGMHLGAAPVSTRRAFRGLQQLCTQDRQIPLRTSHLHNPSRTGVPVTKHRVVQNFTLRESAKSGRHRCQSHGPTVNTQCHPTANKISLRGPIPCFEILGHRAHVDPSTSTECGINNEYIRVPHAVVGGYGARRAEAFGRAFGILQRTGCSRLAACMSREQNLERGTVLAKFACSQAHKWHTRHRRC